MKKIFNTVLFLIFSVGASAQCISIELSISWKKAEDIFFPEQDAVCQPYLLITYRNNSNIPVYFRKIPNEEQQGMPGVFSTILINTPFRMGSFERAVRYLNYSGENYKLNLVPYSYYSSGWDILDDTLDVSKPHAQAMVNDDITAIYEYIRKVMNLERKYEIPAKEDYDTSDIIPENIIKNKYDHFIFLKSGEHHTDSYNLVGFQLVGGNYTFKIEKYLTNYVYARPTWYEGKGYVYETKLFLPDKVGEYNLYIGDFYTNEVSVKFINTKGNEK